MKRMPILAAMLMVLVGTPTMLPAQMMPRLPSFGMPSNVSVGNLSVYGGWVTNAGYTDFCFVAPDSGPDPGLWVEYGNNLSSVYLGASLPFSLGPDWGTFVLNVAGAVPNRLDGRHFLSAPALATPERGASWRADTYWGTAEGLAVIPAFGGISVLGGFRYDCWQTSWKHPLGHGGDNHIPTDSMFTTVNSYVPFLGVLAAGGALTVGAVGFPCVTGNVLHRDHLGGVPVFIETKGVFNQGYFFETFFEYGLPAPVALPYSDFSLSLFGKFSTIEAKSDVDLNDETYYFTYRRSLFILGAKGTLNFDLVGFMPF